MKSLPRILRGKAIPAKKGVIKEGAPRLLKTLTSANGARHTSFDKNYASLICDKTLTTAINSIGSPINK